MVLKSLCALSLMLFCVTGASAQKFLKKIQKATETVSSVIGDGQSENVALEDSVYVRDLLAKTDSFYVAQVYETDENGDTIRNEDGTYRYTYRVLDKDGKVCDPNAAKKYLTAAMKSGGKIVAKVGTGAAVGAAAGILGGGSKKDKWVSAGVGAAVGLVASADDIKELKTQLKARREYLRVIAGYQQTFTDEGLPVDADADLTDYAECETVTKPSSLVIAELEASVEGAKDLPEVSEDDWEKLYNKA